MEMASKVQSILNQLDPDRIRMGEVKKIAAGIRKDHELALALWATGQYAARLVAVLIVDKMQLSQEVLEQLADDLQAHPTDERNQLTDWLLANQLMKSTRTSDLLLSWQHHASPVLRRLFWYHQARLRWTGQPPPANSEALLTSLEKDLSEETEEVQWAMNFCAGQIGVHEPHLRARCIALGESTGLYRDDPVARNCTPSYLPEFIRIEVAKRR